MKKETLLRILLAAILLVGVSCSDNETPGDPTDTISLNMMDELNGHTRLGTTDVYINEANNFYTYSCLIADAGSAGGLGATMPPRLGNLASEVAVTPGHIYQIFDEETVRDFPSGVRAVMIEAAYYHLYVVSPILIDSESAGAVVKYVALYPETNGLPKYEHLIGEMNYSGESVSMKLPKDAECVWHDSLSEVFDIAIEDGTLQITLNREPSDYNGIAGSYAVYMRVGNAFTTVLARVSR